MICSIQAAWIKEIRLEIGSGSAQRKVSGKPKQIIQFCRRRQDAVSDWLSALVGWKLMS